MRNALLGYSYQHYVAAFLLAKMDVEREIEGITLEAKVDHMFDDIALNYLEERFFIQIKDFESIDPSSLKVDRERISINGTWHKLSKDTNIIFFKQIDIIPDCEIFGIPAMKISGVYIISLSRNEIDKKIEQLYRKELARKGVIEQYLSDKLDKRQFVFKKAQLPTVQTFSTKLIEASVKVSRRLLRFENILLIEGKPGIGKSHFVAFLEKELKSTITYRFWVSNQDRFYEDRLRFDSFLSDLAKKIFDDYKDHGEEEIIAGLHSLDRTFIIDGLDHVENYNRKDLEKFIGFINKAKEKCKTIVLSRPLKALTEWKTQALSNWNDKQTRKVLTELFHIDDYATASAIYAITSGYPILVKYIAEHYKLNGCLPSAEKFDSINGYYDHLLTEEKSRQALALFICSRGFIMKSEVRIFLDDYTASIVEEFVAHSPYLFEIRLNRLSLFHDSLITYLRGTQINFSGLMKRFNNTVFASILNGEKRFQSRLGHFDLSALQLRTLVKQYSSIGYFQKMIKGTIDFEAMREFYDHIRNLLSTLRPSDLETIEYYDLALIINLLNRDHVSTSTNFQYTFSRALLFNGYGHDDITSSKYLFGMWYYLHTNDPSILFNLSSDDHYDTKDFTNSLEQNLSKETEFFSFQQTSFKVSKMKSVLKDDRHIRFTDYLQYILINLYLHQQNRKHFPDLYAAVRIFMEGDHIRGAAILASALDSAYVDQRQASWILPKVKKELIAFGINPATNDYLNLTLAAYIKKHGSKGSFDLWPEILSYLRLSLKRKRKIDLGSIYRFWTKYHMRKDYTLFAFDDALYVFEQKNWIDWQSSIRLIGEIQEVSEKGYRDLLARYIIKHDPEFLLEILDNIPENDLQISWFDLESRFIDILPLQQYVSAMKGLFKHSYNSGIDLSDIRNLLASNKVDLLRRDLKMIGYKVRAKSGDRSIGLLEKENIPYILLEPEKSYGDDKTSEQRYNQGIIDHKNIDIIKNKKLTPGQVAATSDGNYTLLAEPELFAQFPKARIKREFHQILFSALTAKSKNSDYHHVTWVMPGTVLKIMHDNDLTIQKKFLKSFRIYLALSMLEL